jgi:hypothetical protein
MRLPAVVLAALVPAVVGAAPLTDEQHYAVNTALCLVDFSARPEDPSIRSYCSCITRLMMRDYPKATREAEDALYEKGQPERSASVFVTWRATWGRTHMAEMRGCAAAAANDGEAPRAALAKTSRESR